MKKIIITISLTLFVTLAGAQAAEMHFEMAKESYVADIPFDTLKVKAETISKRAQQLDFVLPQEDYVDDIPFDTTAIAAKAMKEQ
jgi:hypothetical protein